MCGKVEAYHYCTPSKPEAGVGNPLSAQLQREAGYLRKVPHPSSRGTGTNYELSFRSRLEKGTP